MACGTRVRARQEGGAKEEQSHINFFLLCGHFFRASSHHGRRFSLRLGGHVGLLNHPHES
eukprot:2529186-Rhodomonas_salina.3